MPTKKAAVPEQRIVIVIKGKLTSAEKKNLMLDAKDFASDISVDDSPVKASARWMKRQYRDAKSGKVVDANVAVAKPETTSLEWV